ncbi:type III-B CRISPR-associated protein Cas10/Cmr2 [Thermocoleostomius sinensis]|uniref:Type III-B CRISPR-associated protein Cas10/Cmr2 n=1 Tax=Thermocoleostomius sinensis A174 TaxID=2016057 RepID=A0A9E9C814_9CYAN|nr:type III-B CRISPR-associated protein Cas10/Cmr2 [Thermocoleostomius sinensis]WAL59838.1 type III-B CRISPR-associated protein Cas10/Cmr2 [Thermocoleostomius sinensis A174]
MVDSQKQLTVAIAWCLAWGDRREPQLSQDLLQQFREAIDTDREPPEPLNPYFERAKSLQSLTAEFPKSLQNLSPELVHLWQQKTKIGLVYGGATKIKQYVFEEAKLQDIRGASALLDRINLYDIPEFFGSSEGTRSARQWLENNDSTLAKALIPELLIYYKGGSFLAFCPAALIDSLADAIEKRYTQETLTANSCVVGDVFHPLEIYLGLLQNPIEKTLWLDSLQSHLTNPAVQAYFGIQANDPPDKIEAAFKSRKNFNELVAKLANQFNQRRSGCDRPSLEQNNTPDQKTRPSRRYPPMFETHPYLVRDAGDRRSSVATVTDFPEPIQFSETLARKRWVGQITKQESAEERTWFRKAGLDWDAGEVESWVNKFEQYLRDENLVQKYDSDLNLFDENQKIRDIHKREARSLREIAAADKNGFIAYIYADGNNMGQYIRDHIATPAQYEQFSNDIFHATEKSVYYAIAHHLKPYHYTPDSCSNRTNKDKVWIHPFEIVTIGGDDVLLIVPANKALNIAKTIGDRFEEILIETGRYAIEPSQKPTPHSEIHRYNPQEAPESKCCLSISSSVLITADNTPIYYADKLVSQLLKSAKKKAKDLKEKGYHGGTVDFLTLKAVTMISSNINAFRDQGLTVKLPERQQELKLYAAPYTLHELGGLLETAKAVKKSGFPQSQLYQIRSLLERGKRTAILNYRYFKVRLAADKQHFLDNDFEKAWCGAKTNNGNLAPWIQAIQKDGKTTYETLWRELVELLPFVDDPANDAPNDNDPDDSKRSDKQTTAPSSQEANQ